MIVGFVLLVVIDPTAYCLSAWQPHQGTKTTHVAVGDGARWMRRAIVQQGAGEQHA
uniref:Uncharacterized protein n=1 Tax=Oryza punctata TaxID=4537 RepID=A0A0E0LBN7_ORYPU